MTYSAMSTSDQRKRIVQVLTDAVLHVGDEWMTTREIADEVPWSALTVIQRLNYLAADQTVKRGPKRKGECTWRLSLPRGSA